MKYSIKNIISLFCVVIICLSCYIPVNALENESDSGLLVSEYGLVDLGFRPNIPELPITSGTPSAIPARFDPREDNAVTQVKDQGNTGACWVFGAIATFESAVYKYTGLKENYSEEALRYISSNQMNRFFGSSDIGSYVKDPNEALHHIVALSYLTRRNNPCGSNINWIAPNNTADIGYNTINQLDSDDLLSFEDSYANNNIADVKYINFDFQNVKKNIIDHGGVNTEFCANEYYVNLSKGSFNNREEVKSKYHAIELVGWDDNYSKYNFNSNCIPNNNGAFLFKNSWGTNWGDNGYGWISYEDVTLNGYSDANIIDSVDKVSKNEYMLSYDYLPPVDEMSYEFAPNEDSVCMANVYDISEFAQDYGTINKVTFYTKSIGAFYKVYIVPLSGDNYSMPSMSDLGSIKAMGTVNSEGYITADFSSPYTFNENADKIAVIVKFTVDRDETESIVLVKESLCADYYNPITYPKESFNYTNGVWRDISNGEICNVGNFCIRPTLVRRTPITQNSTLSSNGLIYSGSDVTVNLNLNGNLLYRITENGNTILFEDNQFVRTENSVTFKSSYLSSLGENQYKNIVFEFTDGENQTLKIAHEKYLPDVSISGKVAVGQTISADLGGFSDSEKTFQWQSSSDGTSWSNISNATNSTYTITSGDFLKYLRVNVNTMGSPNSGYPQGKFSPASDNKVVLYGDANLDGTIDIKDKTTIQRYLAGIRELTVEQFVAADVDGDGIVDIKDVNLISHYCAGNIQSFPVETN